MAVVGLSGGGPYTLACAAALPDRVVAAGVLGGVAPTCGPDAISGGLMNLGSAVAPLLKLGGSPLRVGASLLIRAARPVASPALDVYAFLSPQATGTAGPSRVQGDVPRRPAQRQPQAAGRAVSTTSSCSPATGIPARRGQGPGPLVARRPPTTSFRSRTASTLCRGCPTPSCSICPAKVISPGGPR